MTTKTGVCVVGAGFWAEEMHLPTFKRMSNVEVVSVVAASEATARRVAEKHGIETWSTEFRQAISDPRVTLVDVVAPNDVHAPAVIAAARAGKHAICIKPLGRTVEEADTMLEAVEEAGTRLFYAENVPFIPGVQEARRLVESGHIGEVFRVKACEGIGEPHSAWFFDRERVGGGAIIDMAVHSIAFCEYIAGSRVRSVYADADSFVWGARTEAEDTAVLTLRHENGVIGQCEDSWSLVGAMDSRFEAFGSNGRILIDNLHRQPMQVMSTTGSTGLGPGWSYPLPVPSYFADGHQTMLEHFIECLQTGERSPVEGEYGRHIVAVAEAAHRSLRSGQREPVAADTTTG